MKLLVLDQFSQPGGAQQDLLDLLAGMRVRGWQVLVGLPGDGEMFNRVRDIGFETERIACGPYRSGRKSGADVGRFLWQMPRLALAIRRMAERAGAGLIYVNGPRLLPAVPSGFPVLFHAHSYIGPGLVRDLAGRALRRTSAHVIANCEFVAAAWGSYVGKERVSVIYNGVSGPDSLPVRTVSRAAPIVGCIGRIAPEKGQLDFLTAAGMVHRAVAAAGFEIVGAPLFSDRAAARYHAAVRAAAVSLPVSFRGWVSDVYTALSGLDLLLVPSHPQEATTRVILEAYAAGVPVVAMRSGGVPEVIEDGVTGLLATSLPEMARLAVEVLSDPSLRARLAKAGRERWEKRFTLERFRREVLSSLERAAVQQTSRRPSAPEPLLPPESRRIRSA
jgi:glycosyltransferase involved in cell wall biosynthesis